MLTFDVLRKANLSRLPLFKNGKGQTAHSATDGSDWPLSQWSNALEGEVGEVAEALEDFVYFARLQKYIGRSANLIKKIERRDTTLEEKRQQLADELGDVMTYLDILAYRAGIDLGEATVKKWNEISLRSGVPLMLWTNDDGTISLQEFGCSSCSCAADEFCSECQNQTGKCPKCGRERPGLMEDAKTVPLDQCRFGGGPGCFHNGGDYVCSICMPVSGFEHADETGS